MQKAHTEYGCDTAKNYQGTKKSEIYYSYRFAVLENERVHDFITTLLIKVGDTTFFLDFFHSKQSELEKPYKLNRSF